MAISLEKRSEEVKINLAKRDIANVKANVGILIDISGSMQGMFDRGIVQETIDRVFALSFNLDPDKALDVFVFNYGVKHLSQMKETHYGNYIKSVLLNETSVGGGTKYSPAVNEVTDFYKPEVKKVGGLFGFGGKEVLENPQPIFCIFITDGANDDQREAFDAFKRTSPGNVYFQCVGIGDPSSFQFLMEMAEKFDHVGFANLNKLDITDEALYDLLINAEFANWIKKF